MPGYPADDIQDLIEKLDEAEGGVLRLTQAGWASRSLATGHLIQATYRIEGARKALREAVEMLDVRPVQSIEAEKPPPGPCVCRAPHTSTPLNRQGHAAMCPRWGTDYASEWRDNSEREQGR